jgi:heme oxygenase (mycobilin-producing)
MKRLSALLLGALLAAGPAVAQPVTLINVFEVPPGRLEETIRFWETARDFLSTQPGFVSTRLHQAIAQDARFQLINVAVWESADAYATATGRIPQEVRMPPPEGLRFSAGLFRAIRE